MPDTPNGPPQQSTEMVEPLAEATDIDKLIDPNTGQIIGSPANVDGSQ